MTGLNGVTRTILVVIETRLEVRGIVGWLPVCTKIIVEVLVCLDRSHEMFVTQRYTFANRECVRHSNGVLDLHNLLNESR